MTKIEALEFLELPESASEEEILSRLKDKLAYFEQLSEKAPSEFLRRLHAKNVIKVRQIAKESREWSPYDPAPAVVGSAALAVSDPGPGYQSGTYEESGSLIASQPPSFGLQENSSQENSLPPNLDEEPSSISRFFTKFVSGILPGRKKEKEQEIGPAGWLVRHTENQSSVMLPLFPGKNYLGRKSNPKFQPFLVVEDDPCVSKVHAIIHVEGEDEGLTEGLARFYICDDPASNEGKASTNGTFINGKEERIMERTPLLENDAIQIGVTKYILRYNKQNIEKIINEVEDSEYIHTVVVDIL